MKNERKKRGETVREGRGRGGVGGREGKVRGRKRIEGGAKKEMKEEGTEQRREQIFRW